MSTLFYCKVCNTRNHWATDVCPKATDGGLSRLAPSGTKTEPINGNVKPRGLREKEAHPSRRGRPKIHKDRKAYMRAFMVKYRKELKLRAKVVKV